VASRAASSLNPAPEAESFEFRTGRELWDRVVTSNPIAAMLVRDLDQEQRTTVQDVLTGMLRERLRGGGRAMTG
jgi:hypothetical protein